MAREVFLYQTLEIPGESADSILAEVHRPTLYITIEAPGGKSALTTVILDSGADVCMFPLSLLDYFGLDVASLPSSVISGVGNEANHTYFAPVTLRFGTDFIHTATVGFSAGMESMAFGLLGQIGFFDSFHVEFRLSEGTFTVESARKPPIQ